MALFPSHLADQTVTIQTATETYGTSGAPQKSWANTFTCVPAGFQQLSGDEGFQYEAERRRRLVDCLIPATYTVEPEMRVVFGAINYEIIGVNTEYRNPVQVLTLEVVDA